MINQDKLVGAIPGDVLVLTKPLGTSVASIIKPWLNDPKKKERLMLLFKKDELDDLFKMTQKYIDRSNEAVLKLLAKYDFHAVKEISNGLLKDAEKLLQTQSQEVDFIIYNLPVISKLKRIGYAFASEPNVQVLNGTTPEISGGLLISMLKEDAMFLSMDLFRTEGYESYIIGLVEEGTRTAKMVDHVVVHDAWISG